jgi:beta-glucosidase
MGKKVCLSAALVLLALAAPARAATPDDRAAQIVKRMTLEEKVRLSAGVFGCVFRGADGFVPGISRLGVPDQYFVGAGMGVTNVCDRPGKGMGPATELPAPIAMAASWDPKVAFEHGTVIGRETRAIGFNVSIGGAVNLVRDPRGGRTFENEGEDPLLAGRIVAAQLRGIQSRKVAATIKHYALNNGETHRLTQSTNVDERTMRELELRAFEIGVKESGVHAVMCSYNKVNGVPACQNRHLLTDVLKRDWGFKGWVMTDWWACSLPIQILPGDACEPAKAALAGLDQEQPNLTFFGPLLLAAAATGGVPQSRIDDIAHRVIRSLIAAGVVDDPPVARGIDPAAGVEPAQRLSEQTAVLLKNQGALLPLDRRKHRRIAAIGRPAGEDPASVAGSSVVVDSAAPDSALEGLRDVAPGADVRYDDGSDRARAAALARASDVAIVYVRDTAAEGVDKPNLALAPGSDALVSAVAAANPRTIVVVMSGSAVTMPWLGGVPAVLEAWYPGERGGHAIARLLFGDANPSGRLPLTFPAREADLPASASPERWPGTSRRIDYTERLLVGYRWYDTKGIKPLFPFGFGLSYGGRFKYSALKLRRTRVRAPAQVRDGHRLTRVSVRVRNTGRRRAAEVVQLYTGFPAAAGEPRKRLIGFRKVWLAPRRSTRVHFTIDDRALAYWGNGWEIARGGYPIWAASSAAKLRLRKTLRVR